MPGPTTQQALNSQMTPWVVLAHAEMSQDHCVRLRNGPRTFWYIQTGPRTAHYDGMWSRWYLVPLHRPISGGDTTPAPLEQSN